MENGEDSGGRRKKRWQEGVGSLNFDPEHLEDRKEAEREAQGAEDLNKNCRESESPLSCLIRGFRNKHH